MHTRLLLSLVFMKISLLTSAQQESYWQQYVDYEIHVKLDDVNHMLEGRLTLAYTNHSPDVLSEIWMHLWPNAYSSPYTELGKQFMADKSREMLLAKEEDLGFIDQLAFQVDGKEVAMVPHPDYPDVASLRLNNPLLPGQTIAITTPFRVKIPDSRFSRLGHAEQSYQLTQWYPKPAVYDHQGWHAMPYLNQGEFYSEFGEFDVFITVPSNYIVAASGDLQTESEKAFLLEKAAETAQITSFGDDLTFPPSASTQKTLHYRLENAHDFAWFTDKRFHVLKGEMQLPFSGRTVHTWSYFTNLEANLWMKSIEYLNRSVMAYSNYVGEYVWNVAQAVEGALSAGAGMEYPTITIIGQMGNAQALDNVITHEVGHNWFYGMLGTNEREFAWMDEGINSYYENRYMNTWYADENPLAPMLGPLANVINTENLNGQNLLDLSWFVLGGLERMNKSQPLEQTSNNFTSINYGLLVYQKVAYLMRYMDEFLGQGQFDRVMSKYFETWVGKHPYPKDIQAVFEAETGENMAWFFEGLLQSDRSLDYSINEVMVGQSTLSARVENKTDIAGPFSISLMEGDSVLRTEWHRGFTGTQTLFIKKKSASENITALRIDAEEMMPDYNRENNTHRVEGLFKKIEPLKLKWLAGIDNPYQTTIYYSPLVGYNVNDKWMLGLGVWNSTFATPKLEWVAAPFYSFERKQLVGQGSIGLNLYPEDGIFNRVRVSASAARYHTDTADANYYTRFQPAVEAQFRPKNFKSSMKHSVKYRYVAIEESRNFWVGPVAEDYVVQKDTFAFNELSYRYANTNVRLPHRASLTWQQGPELMKLFMEWNIDIPIRKYAIETRIFAGWMDYTEADPLSRYAYSLTGVSSYNDYLYDDILPGRNASEGLWSNQITRRDGFFKLPAESIFLQLQSESLLALNLEIPVPKIPLAFFADAAYLNVPDGLDAEPLQYDAGVMLRLLNNNLEVYFPLLASEGLADPFEGKYGESISFMFNLNGLNPFEILRTLSF